jgi:hypothetical protein
VSSAGFDSGDGLAAGIDVIDAVGSGVRVASIVVSTRDEAAPVRVSVAGGITVAGVEGVACASRGVTVAGKDIDWVATADGDRDLVTAHSSLSVCVTEGVRDADDVGVGEYVRVAPCVCVRLGD